MAVGLVIYLCYEIIYLNKKQFNIVIIVDVIRFKLIHLRNIALNFIINIANAVFNT